MPFKYVKPERVLLAGHPELKERWVQHRIAEDPSILGLGELVLKDKERSQPRAGRLDLMLQDAGFIPLVAIQMQAFRLGDQISLLFTTVLDQQTLGLVDEDEGVAETADREYWEKRGSKETLEATDELLGIVHAIDPGLALKYNKFYIGLAHDGQPSNFVIFRPTKQTVKIEFRLPQLNETQKQLDGADLDVMDYDARWGRYRVRLSKCEIEKHRALLTSLMQQAHENA